MEIRAYHAGDEDAAVALVRDEYPTADDAATREALRERSYIVHMVADDGTKVCGAAHLARPSWFGASDVMAKVRVTPVCRGEGIGSALWRAIMPHIPGGTTAHTDVVDHDETSRRIAEHWGFRAHQHPIESSYRLDDAVTAPRPLPPNVTIRRLASFVDVDDPVLDALLRDADTSPEASVTGATGIESFAAEAGTFAVIAELRGVPVGFCVAKQVGPAGFVLMTATLPAARGLGIGRAVKEAMHVYGHERGVDRFTTLNEADNVAIRNLNAELGYVVVGGSFRMRRPF
jgi:GNAT superfamily N-acetyltransferase